jgi:4-amino-4-deoxy-L-arabinose transferase-like glycosyltransferase
VFDRIETATARIAGLWAALALTLVLALPGFFTLPPVDRDEVLFSQSSAQMLQSGDLIDIRFDDQTRYKKPVGIYWMQSAAAALTGAPDRIWSYRLVSLLGAMIAVGATYGIARTTLPRGPAFLAAVTLASTMMIGVEARLAKTDAMLLATIALCGLVLARAFLPNGRAQDPKTSRLAALGFWAALGASILIKGPIGPMVIGLALAGLCLHRRDLALLRALRPVSGLALMLVMVAPWLIAITIKSDGAFWMQSVGKDMLAKLGEGQESHGAPPGSYLLAIWLTFWPGSMLLAVALPALWRARHAPVVAFGLAWTLPTWIIFELTATKLLHYTLPTYPALALLTVWAIWTYGVGRAWAFSVVLGAIPALVLAALAWQAGQIGAPLTWPFWLGIAGLLVATPACLAALRHRAPVTLALCLVACGLAFSGAIYPSLARMPVLWPAQQIADRAAAMPADCTLSVVGYAEPSLIFLTRRAAHLDTAAEAAARLREPGCLMTVVEEANLAAYRKRAGDLTEKDEFRGMSLGSGKMLRLHVFVRPAD